MKPSHLALYLMLVACPVWADWTLTVKAEVGDMYYLDFDTVRKNGNLIRVWEINNFPKKRQFAGIQGVFSTRYRAEYDCRNERLRYLAISAHSEPFARGEILGQDSDGNWIELPPQSNGLQNLRILCKDQ